MIENIKILLAKMFWEKIETQEDCAQVWFVWKTTRYAFKWKVYITKIERVKIIK